VAHPLDGLIDAGSAAPHLIEQRPQLFLIHTV
jgi:hypothetical protein